VGREGVMTTLHQQLQQTERVAITAVAGMGEVGKTELALQYARYHWEQGTYPGGVCWLGVRGVDVGTQILQFAVQELGFRPPEDWDLAAKINYCWRQWPTGDVLLVLDDVEKYEQIAAYLPPTLPKLKFKVLITTRVQVLAGSIQRLHLNVLDEAAALDLLRSLIGERIDREIEAAKQLCRELGYLPLGLELVGRYLQRKEDLSIAEMRRRLALQHRSLQERSPDMTAQRGVEAAFELSWQELDEPAQKLACVLSIFAYKYISSHRGFISSFYKSNNVDKIQLDASVNSGSSGSPLIDPNTSKVIGIITRKETGLSHDFNKVRETLGNTGTILEEYKQNIQSQDADFIQDQKHRKLEEQKKAVLSCQSYTDQIKAVKAINKNQNNMLELTKILSSSIEEVSKINDNLTNLTKEIERSANVGIGYAYSVEHFINQKLFN